MIITNICLLLEALSIVICLHYLYGDKFRLDIETVGLLSLDMIMMQVIDYLKMPSIVSIFIYPLIIFYCGIKFGFKIKMMIVNIMLCVVFIGGIQLLVFSTMCYFGDMHNVVHTKSLVISAVVFILVIGVLPFINVKRISMYLQEKERILIIATIVCLSVIFSIIIGYKRINVMELNNTIVLFVCVLLMLILSIKLIQYKLKAIEAETELKVHQLYSDSFQRLIDNIRLKQHEFDNHINVIYSLHLSCNTLEELIEAQNDYCKQITRNNRFNKLLAHDNSVIRGFLYTRFVEIDRMGIEISYQVVLKEHDIGVPVYKIIEILGNLINNAVEALEIDGKRRGLHVEIVEIDDFFIEVRNESPYIAYDMLGDFFNKGYSKKGENRGLGLYNVKQICEEWKLSICCENAEIEGKNWLIFRIQKAKESKTA